MPAVQAGRASWPSWNGDATEGSYEGYPRNISYIDNLKLNPELTPTEYHIEGTSPNSKILFLGVKILDSTGNEPYHGDVLVEGEKFLRVSNYGAPFQANLAE
jgi:hypothetical protein